ncbi:MAG: hypothetical protein LC808_29810, partial [Actinobacteria bacterium]|nr:hypothetical protein [Actinomycetota bacterium]
MAQSSHDERSAEPPSGAPIIPIPKSGRSLAQAVATALVLLGLIIIFNLLGPNGFFFLAFVVVEIALFELFDMLNQSGHRTNSLFGCVC